MAIESRVTPFPIVTTVKSYENGRVTSQSNTTESRGTAPLSRNSITTPGYYSHAVKPLPENHFTYGENGSTKGTGFRRVHTPVGFIAHVILGINTQWMETSGCVPSTPPSIVSFSTLEEQAVSSQAINKLRLKIKDQSINIAQFYAEREQTIRLLTTTVIRLRKSLTALRHGDFMAAAAALGISAPSGAGGYLRRWERDQSRAMSRGWLELQYGWLPLISDVYGALRLFEKQFEDKPLIIKASARSLISMDKFVDLGINSEVQHSEIHRGKYEVSCRCSYRITSPPAIKTLSEVGVLNPLYLAWELMPYSFVIDWFIPIGNYLSAFDATVGCEFVSGSVTYFKKVSHAHMNMGTGVKTYLPGYSHYYATEGVWSYEVWEVSCNRVGLTDFPLPQIPVFKNPFSITHFYNALSLLKLIKR